MIVKKLKQVYDYLNEVFTDITIYPPLSKKALLLWNLDAKKSFILSIALSLQRKAGLVSSSYITMLHSMAKQQFLPFKKISLGFVANIFRKPFLIKTSLNRHRV